MKFRFGFMGFLVGIAALLLSPSGLYGEERIHVVQKGETFYSIARALGIKPDELMKYNGISDPARLQAGQRLKIPGTGAPAAPGASVRPAAAPGAYTNYRVIRGDTLYSIARKHNATVALIRELNNLPETYLLREGDSLRIPAAGGSAPARTPGGTENRERESPPVNPGLRWPVSAREVNYMTGKLSGVVITGTRDESVKSLTRGTVLSAGPYRGFGKVIILQVEGGYLYVYGGCESLSVKEGDKIDPGAELGKLGIDAVTTEPQLFFMVYKSNVPVDPAKAPRA